MTKLINKWLAKRKDQNFQNQQLKKLTKAQKSDHELAEKIHTEVFDEIACLDCANCCKSIPPIVSARDSKRIAKHLNLKPKAFHDTYLRVDEDGDTVFKESPCVFLEADNKCQIYEVRPAACRAYPHSGDYNFFKNLPHHKRNMKYCPALLEIVTRLATHMKA